MNIPKSKLKGRGLLEIDPITLEKLHFKMRKNINRAYKRVLPFNEEFTDRWEKAKYLNFGKGASIYDSSIVLGDVAVGKNTWIGPFTVLDGSGKLKIGSNCSVSAGVQIYTHDSVKWAISGGKEDYERSPVKIGARCYIGPNVIISRGVTIGRCSVIGANSFVNKSVPAYSVAYGSPCELKGKVFIVKGKIRIRYGE